MRSVGNLPEVNILICKMGLRRHTHRHKPLAVTSAVMAVPWFAHLGKFVTFEQTLYVEQRAEHPQLPEGRV